MIAVLALLLSALSFGWQVYNVVRSNPRIRVRQRAHFRIGGANPTTYVVVVVNMGSSGVTVDDVGFRSLATNQQLSVTLLRDENPDAIRGPELPARIDGRDAKNWIIPEPLMPRGEGIPLEAWALQHVGRRPWPWHPLRRVGMRMTVSSAVTRNI